MISLNKMQHKIDSLLSVFTKLITTLEKNIAKLDIGISLNKEKIACLEEENNAYSNKIKEYEALTANLKGFINR